MGQPDADHPQLVLALAPPRGHADGGRPRCMQRRSGRPVPCRRPRLYRTPPPRQSKQPRRPNGRRIPHCLTGADSRFDAHCRAHARPDGNPDAHRRALASADRRRDAHRLAHARADSHPEAYRHAHARADRHTEATAKPRPRRPRLRRPARQPLPPRQPHRPSPRRQRGPGWSAAKTSGFARSIPPRRSRLPGFGTCAARRGRPSPRKSGSTCWTWRRAQSRGGYSSARGSRSG